MTELTEPVREELYLCCRKWSKAKVEARPKPPPRGVD